MKFDVIVMLIFLATLPQTLNVIFSMEIALRHHRFCDFKYSNLECQCSNKRERERVSPKISKVGMCKFNF